MPDQITATNEMLGLFKTAWDANTAALVGSVPLVRYEGVEDDVNPPPTSDWWAWVSVRHREGEQATLANHEGQRRWDRMGVLTVQVFKPLSSGGGLNLARQVARVAQNAFQGQATASGVWFRRVSMREVGPTGAWFQINVIVEFTYDELQ